VYQFEFDYNIESWNKVVENLKWSFEPDLTTVDILAHIDILALHLSNVEATISSTDRHGRGPR
jgi:hypothetical protein